MRLETKKIIAINGAAVEMAKNTKLPFEVRSCLVRTVISLESIIEKTNKQQKAILDLAAMRDSDGDYIRIDENNIKLDPAKSEEYTKEMEKLSKTVHDVDVFSFNYSLLKDLENNAMAEMALLGTIIIDDLGKPKLAKAE